MKTNLKVFFVTCLFCILILEIIGIKFFPKKNTESYNYNSRSLIFQQGDVFLNVSNIFKYYPNKDIKHEAYYYINNKFIREYSYNIRTNNYGLNQNNDLIDDKKSILFLGASFTEGSGSDAWLNLFNGDYKGYQIINGGILGTGTKQAYLLENYISKKYKINKVIYLYVPEEFERDVWNLNKNQIECLKNQNNCKGDEILYGFKYDDTNDIENYLRNLQNNRYNTQKMKFDNYKISLKNLLTNSFIVRLFRDVRYYYFHPQEEIIKNNIQYIKKLTDKYNENIIFIKMASKNEIILSSNVIHNLVKKKINDIYPNKEIYECNFDKNLNYFYEYDGHPNQIGYKYLYNCVSEILKNL